MTLFRLVAFVFVLAVAGAYTSRTLQVRRPDCRDKCLDLEELVGFLPERVTYDGDEVPLTEHFGIGINSSNRNIFYGGSVNIEPGPRYLLGFVGSVTIPPFSEAQVWSYAGTLERVR